jgi:hypothetical protein
MRGAEEQGLVAVADLKIFVSQVAGTLPMLRDGKGRLLKPAMEHELSVYEALGRYTQGTAGDLLRFVPRFFGTTEVGLKDLHALATKCQDESFVSRELVRDRDRRRLSSMGDGGESGARAAGDHAFDLATAAAIEATQGRSRGSSREIFASVDVASGPKPEFSIATLWARLASDEAGPTSKRVGRLMSTERAGETVLTYIVLEDLTHSMLEPNVMDLKLGTRQHSDSESAVKKARKIARCAETTSAAMGIRIGGAQCVWSEVADDGAERQRRLHRGKYWGRSLDPDGARSALRDFVICPATARVRTAVVRRLCAELSDLAKALRQTPWRWWSSSLLIAYDAATTDGSAALVRLIDYAHVDMAAEPGATERGPDEGALFGIETLLAIFDELLSSSTIDATEGGEGGGGSGAGEVGAGPVS